MNVPGDYEDTSLMVAQQGQAEGWVRKAKGQEAEIGHCKVVTGDVKGSIGARAHHILTATYGAGGALDLPGVTS